MPAAPLLFFGDSATGEVWEFGAGITDDGVAFVPLAKSARVAPAGIGGECIFTALYFAVTHRIVNVNTVLVRVTPIIDGVPQDGTGGTTDERKIVTLGDAALFFKDAFTDANGTQLTAHTPDIPGSGTYDNILELSSIQTNRLSLSLQSLVNAATRNTVDVVGGEGNGEWYCDVERDLPSTANFSFTFLRAHSHATNYESIDLGIEWLSTTINLYLQRINSGGGAAESSLVATFAFALNDKLRFGMTITGLSVQAWTEPYGGGARTLRGSAKTFTTVYADTSHRRFGLRIQRTAGSGVTPMGIVDNVTAGLAADVRKTELFELGLSIPNIHLTIERGRNAMRGTWFQYLVEGTQLDAGAGELTFEVSELEYEIVRESTPEGG